MKLAMIEHQANACLGAVRRVGLIGTCRERAVGIVVEDFGVLISHEA